MVLVCFAGPPKTKYEEYVVLTEEFESELRSDALLQNRVKAAKDLTEICKTRRAESVSLSNGINYKFCHDTHAYIIHFYESACSTPSRRYGLLCTTY
jgi:hypothetical protein